MNKLFKYIPLLFLLLFCMHSFAQKPKPYAAIYSGTPWFDDRGNVLSAHAACIVKDHGRYYIFGEKHTDAGNNFTGFNCYSSTDLYNWKFESLALPVQDTGRLGPNRVGERVKVMQCPQTGEYVMYMHTDNLGYKDQGIDYATAKNITGPYTYRGPLLFNGKPIRKWDMGTFQDTDGTGYLLIHSGDIYQLSADYKSITQEVVKSIAPECESPAILKKGDIYFWLGSHRTSWERNDNFYYTATSLKGPWTSRGTFAPAGTLTWNSQTTFVLPIAGSKDTTYMFMGDRWSYPYQASSATYVWQPVTVSGTSLSIPQFMEGWQINTATGVYSPAPLEGRVIAHQDKRSITYSGAWAHSSTQDSVQVSRSDEKGASFSVGFSGKQIGFYSLSQNNGGYARVTLTNSQGKTVNTCTIDMYSLYAVSSLKFISPLLPAGRYTLTVTVMGEHSKWTDKKRTEYGSKGNFVSLKSIIIK